MDYDTIKTLPLLFTSKAFGNIYVRKTSWEETMREMRKLVVQKGMKADDLHIISVHLSDCRDGTSVYHFELHGKA